MLYDIVRNLQCCWGAFKKRSWLACRTEQDSQFGVGGGEEGWGGGGGPTHAFCRGLRKA